MTRAKTLTSLLVVAVLSAGCGDDDVSASTTRGEMTETSGDEDESETSASTTTTASTGTGESETGDETESGDEAETGDDSETGDEMLPTLEELEELCEASCMQVADCGVDVVDCVPNCVAHHEGYLVDAQCALAEVALTECINALSCEQLFDYLTEEPGYPCMAEEEQVCIPGQCDPVFDEDPMTGDCSVDFACELEPLREVVCVAGEGCTCFEAGAQVASCDDDVQVCDTEGSYNAVNQCCGWSL